MNVTRPTYGNVAGMNVTRRVVTVYGKVSEDQHRRMLELAGLGQDRYKEWSDWRVLDLEDREAASLMAYLRGQGLTHEYEPTFRWEP